MDRNKTTDRIVDLSKKGSLASAIMMIAAITAMVLRIISLTAYITNKDKTHDHEFYIGMANHFPQIFHNMIYIPIFLICISLFKGIVKEETPFRNRTADKMKKIAVLLAVSSVVPSFLAFIIYMIATPSDMIDFRHSVFNGILQVNLNYIFAAFLFFVLTVTFRYGCQLQQESDETL